MLQLPYDKLVLATGNLHKARELRELLWSLPVALVSLPDFPKTTPIEEDGQTLAENARRKAAGYAQMLGHWVLADDTGLLVDALGGEPGVRSARFAGENATMAENRSRLLAKLASVPVHNRTARFVCHLAIANPAGNVVAEAMGECRGRIRTSAAGEFGFGYDALFEIVEYGRTLAEFGPVATAMIGHRGRGVRKLWAAIGAR